jgi:hypothetical protein
LNVRVQIGEKVIEIRHEALIRILADMKLDEIPWFRAEILRRGEQLGRLRN